MDVTFYKCSNAYNEYPKTFTDAKLKSCTIIEPTSTKNPVLKLEKDETLKGYTHAIIWGDVYILENDFNYDHGFMYIRASRSSVDTHWNTIKTCKAHITRSADSRETMLLDKMATQYENDIVSCVKIGTAFTKGCTYVFIKGVTAQEQQ